MGRKGDPRRDLFLEKTQEQSFKDFDDCCAQRMDMFSRLRSEALRIQMEHREKSQKKHTDVERPKVGNFVWLLPVGKRKGKLQKRRRGPFQVLDLLPNFLVKLKFLTEARTITVHQRRLCAVKGEHTIEDLKILAASGEGEFIVDCLLEHRGKTKKDLEFLVSWSGYELEESTWEPLSGLKETIALEEYLEQHEELRHIVV
ncbi:hypothetical protein ADUPG1_011802 [Aduncisulcus paluster]|uniref:Chromo domain-containing protein n=1 Tax=Aduncisulcus paluster TaxID=2918883 RepID=A0ABQ5JZI7_9EUKA|nr:hypothetical protein ADUPG1_011802 [Aduncisulcus paluster]